MTQEKTLRNTLPFQAQQERHVPHARRVHRALPTKLIRRGAALLNLQCWLWGQDIRRAGGNLLLQYGAVRLRPPVEVSGCSQYSFALQSGAMLRLWGFGMHVGDADGGCYLNRYEFVPRTVIGEDCWTASAFRMTPRGTPVQAMPEALRWIAGYEGWVLQEAGAAWRLRAACGGPDTSGCAQHMAEGWAALARDLERWMRAQSTHQVRNSGKDAASRCSAREVVFAAPDLSA